MHAVSVTAGAESARVREREREREREGERESERARERQRGRGSGLKKEKSRGERRRRPADSERSERSTQPRASTLSGVRFSCTLDSQRLSAIEQTAPGYRRDGEECPQEEAALSLQR
jgi:hypothetical protein